jgi:hypothetical protein
MSGEDQRQPPLGSPLDQARFVATIHAESEALRASIRATQATPPGNAAQGTGLTDLRPESEARRTLLQ